MQRIIINNLKISCIVGVKPEERLKTQEIIVDLSLLLDLNKAADSDKIEDTVDYEALTNDIIKFIEKSQFKLLEKLAYQTAKLAKELSKAKEVKITIKKPSAIKAARYASVEFILS